MTPSIRRLIDRPRTRARPLHGRAEDQPPPAARADGAVGVTAALAPVIAACRAATTPPPAPSARSAPRRPPASGQRFRAARAADARADAAPTPEGELFIYNWTQYMGERLIKQFEDKYGVKVTYEVLRRLRRHDSPRSGRQGGGYDVTLPDVDRHPRARRSDGVIRRSTMSSSRTSRISAPSGQNPGYDPGNAHSIPYMWWTTGVAYDTAKVPEKLTSWNALWDTKFEQHIVMLDDHARGVRGGAVPAGHDPNTTNDAELDAALADAQGAEAAAPHVHDGRHRRPDRAATSGSAHAWGRRRVPGHHGARRRSSSYIPEEGGVRGSDTMVILAGRPAPDRGQPVHRITCSTRR